MGYSYGHHIRDIQTHWAVLNDRLGIVTEGTVGTKKTQEERLQLYFKAIDGKIYHSYCLNFVFACGYLAMTSKELQEEYKCKSDCNNLSNEDWANGLMRNNIVSKAELKLIKEHIPNVEYILDKCIKNKVRGNIDIYDVLRVWQEHPEMEYLVAAGQYKLGLNKSFWKLSDSKKKQIVVWIRQHKGQVTTLQWILDDINGLDHELREFSMRKRFPYGVTEEYYKEQCKLALCNIEDQMRDYYKMCKFLKKDLKDKYWLMPKDMYKAHRKVMKEREAELKVRESREKALRNECIKKIFSKYSKYNFTDGKFTIAVASSMDEIIEQAEVLKQCLISAGYDKKMADGDIILVFIRKEGKPIATMEVHAKQKSIGQFYADEHNRENCLPSRRVKELGKQWLENYKNKKAA